jgi:signal transduction histidine kinase
VRTRDWRSKIGAPAAIAGASLWATWFSGWLKGMTAATNRSGSRESATQLIARAADELQLALEKLRELARGLHPALLAERGLGRALVSVVARAPFRVELSGDFDQRLPAPVEAAFYFIVSESLTNDSGLKGLADRVEALGGRFSFASPAGGGTRVRAELPV